MCNAATLPADAIVNILLGSHVIHPRGAARSFHQTRADNVMEVQTVWTFMSIVFTKISPLCFYLNIIIIEYSYVNVLMNVRFLKAIIYLV